MTQVKYYMRGQSALCVENDRYGQYTNKDQDSPMWQTTEIMSQEVRDKHGWREVPQETALLFMHSIGLTPPAMIQTQQDIPLKDRKFKVMNGGNDVLGGSVPYENAYISYYPNYEICNKNSLLPKDNKYPYDLKIGESTFAEYWLSGEHTVQTVTRTK